MPGGAKVAGFEVSQQQLVTRRIVVGRLRPGAAVFRDVTTGLPSALIAAFPQFASGFVTVDTSTLLWGAEANFLLNLYRSDPESFRGCSVNLISGFRFLQLSEDLEIRSRSRLAMA